MMQSKLKSIFKAGIPLSLLLVGAVVGMMYLSQVQNVVIEQQVPQKSWHLIALASEGNPGAGAGGILWIGFVNYTAGITPTQNSTATMETWTGTIGYPGWNNTDNFNQELKHTSIWYIVIKVRGNATQCNRTTFWQDTDLRVRWTSADLTIGADTVMERVVTQNGTGAYLWVNFYDDNGGVGFHLTKDQIAQITSIKFEAYY